MRIRAEISPDTVRTLGDLLDEATHGCLSVSVHTHTHHVKLPQHPKPLKVHTRVPMPRRKRRTVTSPSYVFTKWLDEIKTFKGHNATAEALDYLFGLLRDVTLLTPERRAAIDTLENELRPQLDDTRGAPTDHHLRVTEARAQVTFGRNHP